MFTLYEHLEDGDLFLMGDYETLGACQRATELRWDLMRQQGYERGMFHCERTGTHERAVGWVYGNEVE